MIIVALFVVLVIIVLYFVGVERVKTNVDILLGRLKLRFLRGPANGENRTIKQPYFGSTITAYIPDTYHDRPAFLNTINQAAAVTSYDHITFVTRPLVPGVMDPIIYSKSMPLLKMEQDGGIYHYQGAFDLDNILKWVYSIPPYSMAAAKDSFIGLYSSDNPYDRFRPTVIDVERTSAYN